MMTGEVGIIEEVVGLMVFPVRSMGRRQGSLTVFRFCRERSADVTDAVKNEAKAAL